MNATRWASNQLNFPFFMWLPVYAVPIIDTVTWVLLIMEVCFKLKLYSLLICSKLHPWGDNVCVSDIDFIHPQLLVLSLLFRQLRWNLNHLPAQFTDVSTKSTFVLSTMKWLLWALRCKLQHCTSVVCCAVQICGLSGLHKAYVHAIEEWLLRVTVHGILYAATAINW